MADADANAVKLHTITRKGILVAKLYSGEAGTMHAAGRGRDKPVCEVPFGRVELFDKSVQAQFMELIAKADCADAFLFKLKLEGFAVHAGEVAPAASFRRF